MELPQSVAVRVPVPVQGRGSEARALESPTAPEASGNPLGTAPAKERQVEDTAIATMTVLRNKLAGSIPNRLTVFVSSSGERWQIVSRFGIKGDYHSRKEAVGEALRIASEHGAKQVLAQSNAGKYKRVWPRFSSVAGGG